MKFNLCFVPIVCGFLASSLFADGPADNQANSVRPVPPPGIAIEVGARTSLQQKLEALQKQVAELSRSKSPVVQRYLPDVEIFSKAVEIALKEDGFFEAKDVERAEQVLLEGSKRAEALQYESAPWKVLEGGPRMVVRGFRSKLDGSVQPYGIVRSDSSEPGQRADIWCRGRSEKGLELQFIATRMSNPDPMPEPGVIMIHPFGRYCNANKLAGEVDTLEVLEHALKEYPINPNRVSIRGFSMGGAAAWHLAVHYPDKWFAANPGAGFSETPKFLKVFQSEELTPTWYEQKLWQMYDCPVWARNLRMLPTIAYSGEIDKQKQAADVMAEACWSLPQDERFELTHIIAPKTAHKVDAAARVEIEKRLATIDRMRSTTMPKNLSFTTTTLKYNKAHWLTVDALGEHWSPANVSCSIQNDVIRLVVKNVTELSINFAADQCPPGLGSTIVVLQDESLSRMVSTFGNIPLRSDLSWGVRLRRTGEKWEAVSPLEAPSSELRKKHGLQGPIDDAFMDAFLFVKPTASGQHPKIDQWVDAEFNRAVREWHRQMRGDVVVKTSEELKPEDIENHHLVLWGDPKSNPTISKIAAQLPIQWNEQNISIGAKQLASNTNAPILIYPNPLNPQRYVVLNSGLTYREYDYLNNARQVPKLPDWAIVDVTTPPNSRFPGKIVDADFFDEKWKVKARDQATR